MKIEDCDSTKFEHNPIIFQDIYFLETNLDSFEKSF